MPPRRHSIAQKKLILREYLFEHHGLTQTQFCRRKGLGESMFSKWLAHQEDILSTPDSRANRDGRSGRRVAKDSLCMEYLALRSRGEQVSVLDLMLLAEQSAAEIFGGATKYNSRYVVCKRLLDEFASVHAGCVTFGGDSESSCGDSDEEMQRVCVRTETAPVPVQFIAAPVSEIPEGVERSRPDVVPPWRTYEPIDANLFRTVSEREAAVFDDSIPCGCRVACDSGCENASMRFECGPWNCRAERCSNRLLQSGSRLSKHLEVFETDYAGRGLRCRVTIPAGELVAEYVGEYMRVAEFRLNRLSDASTYFIETDEGFGIDARDFGNVTRFINHSCSPNLSAERWVVQGITRLGFISSRTVPAFEELTFHYKIANFVCNCSDYCRCACV